MTGQITPDQHTCSSHGLSAPNMLFLVLEHSIEVLARRRGLCACSSILGLGSRASMTSKEVEKKKRRDRECGHTVQSRNKGTVSFVGWTDRDDSRVKIVKPTG